MCFPFFTDEEPTKKDGFVKIKDDENRMLKIIEIPQNIISRIEHIIKKNNHEPKSSNVVWLGGYALFSVLTVPYACQKLI